MPLTSTPWQSDLLRRLRATDHPLWSSLLQDPTRALHLVIIAEPYLTLLLLKLKTIESRLSTTRQPPWQLVSPRDLLLLKPPSSPITAIAEAGRVHSHELTNPSSLAALRQTFNTRLRATPDFWTAHQNARYATLIEIARAAPLPTPLPCHKPDRRPWVLLRPVQALER